MSCRLIAALWAALCVAAVGAFNLFDSVLARIVSDGSLGRFSRAHVKETDRIKQLGFYVDLDDQMRVRSTPSQVTSDLAKDHLDFARDVLETLRSHLPTASSPLPRRA